MEVIITKGTRLDGKKVKPDPKRVHTVSLDVGRDLIYSGKGVLHVPAPTVKRAEPEPVAEPAKADKAEPKPRAKKAAPKKVG